MQHRGLTRSKIFLVIFLPVFLFYGKRAAPYFVAFIQHSLVGDYITNGGVQLLWPFSHQAYGLEIVLTSPTNILIEWILFLTSLALMVGTNDMRILFETHLSNFLLVIPFIAVLAPAMLNMPLHVPVGLLLPHLVYSALFTLSILIAFKAIWRNKRKTLDVNREVTVDRISSA